MCSHPRYSLELLPGWPSGWLSNQLIGAAVGEPALYAIVGMCAVFASAARAPLTALASTVEMTGDFTLTLPVMLAVAVATTVSRALSYGTIYTTKLLRRGIDIDRPTPTHAFAHLTAADAMHRFTVPLDLSRPAGDRDRDWTALLGPVTRVREPQALFANDSLAQALRQLVLYGRDGLPVIDTDARRVQGWLTNQNVLRAVDAYLADLQPDIAASHQAAEWADPQAATAEHDPRSQLAGYRIVEHSLASDSAAVGRTLGELDWPAGHLPVSILHDRQLVEVDPIVRLTAGDRINILVLANERTVTLPSPTIPSIPQNPIPPPSLSHPIAPPPPPPPPPPGYLRSHIEGLDELRDHVQPGGRLSPGGGKRGKCAHQPLAF